MKGGSVHNFQHFTGKKGKKGVRRKSRNRLRKKRVHKNKYALKSV
jgi:hypothetical protein